MQSIQITGLNSSQNQGYNQVSQNKFSLSRKMFAWIGRRGRSERAAYSRLSSSETRGRSPCCCRCTVIPQFGRALLVLSEADQSLSTKHDALTNLRQELNARGILTEPLCVAPSLAQLIEAIDALLAPPTPPFIMVVIVAPIQELVPSMFNVSSRAPFSVAMLLSRLSSADVPKLLVVDSEPGPVQLPPDLLCKHPDVFLIVGGRVLSPDCSTCSSSALKEISESLALVPHTAVDLQESGTQSDNDKEDEHTLHFVTGPHNEDGFWVGHARGRFGHVFADDLTHHPCSTLVDGLLCELRVHPTNKQPLYLDVLLGGLVRRSLKPFVPSALSSMSRVFSIPPRRTTTSDSDIPSIHDF